MPKRTDISSILVIGAGAGNLTAPSHKGLCRMNRLLTSALLVPVLLAGCGAVKLDGPLTQDKLDEIQGECGMSGAMLLAVEPDGTATISTGSVNMEGPEAEAIDMIYKGKCLKERLDALGVKHAVSVEMQSPQFQREIERGLQNM